ncbi:MAG TPA: MFS transporter [Terracidiphilus sp.]|jgi:ACS family glucarate transporter-like MFS transporter
MAGLSGFALASYMARANISIAAELMIPALGLSHVRMGQIFTSFLIGYAIFQVPGGVVGDRYGPRLTLGISALIWSASTLLTGLLGTLIGARTAVVFTALWIIRFILGASEATTFPVGNRAVRNWMPPHLRALGNSIMFMGTSIASAITAPLVSKILTRFGWEASFYVTAGPPLVIGVLWLWLARDAPPAALSMLATGATNFPNLAASPETPPQPLSRLLRQRNVLLLIASYVSEGYVLFIFVFWIYIYLVEKRGFSVLRGGLMAAIPWITALLLTPLGGYVCDRIARTHGRLKGAKAVIMTGYGLSGAMLFLAAYAPSRSIAVGALSLSIACLMSAESSFWSSAVHLADGPVGLLSGTMNTAGIIGGIISTSLIPVLSQKFGWVVALGSGSLMALVCVVLWAFVSDDK